MSNVSTDIKKETLLAWKNGSSDAFEEIVNISMTRAYSVALSLVGNAEDAKDLSQEAFIAAYRAKKSFDEERPFFPWFYRILRNRCLNFIRSRSKRGEISMDVLIEKDSGVESPERAMVRKEDAEALWKALFTLSPEHREIIVLRNFQDLAYREISEVLGISQGTVMSRLFYARKALYDVLKDRLRVEGDDTR
ncbi:MAG: RNA polymerase sigma factor [Candidatus Krumholzibacteria bacterium]|nr:RNA polymerase sigma factor [Candidatus Krumholzibacteria bacterium]